MERCSPFYLFAMTREEKLKFYHSTAWKKKSMEILRRDHFECQECRKRIKAAAEEGILLPATERRIRRAAAVHHIIPLEDKYELRLDDGNLEAICATCHNKIHDRTTEKWNKVRKKKPVTEEKW